MRIGPLEITVIRNSRIENRNSLSEGELESAFRVGPETPWFRGVLEVIDAVERKQITEGRLFAENGRATECVKATGGGAALELLRDRLVRLREQSVRGME